MIWIIRLLIAAVGTVGATQLVRWLRSAQANPATPLDPRRYILEPPVDVAAMRREDGKLVVSWTKRAEHVHIYLGETADAIERDAPAATVTGAQEITLTNVEPYTRYHLEVVFNQDTEAERRVQLAERVVPMERVPNFRDIGGYQTIDGRRVAWGKIYRAASLAHMTPGDQQRLRDLGVQLVCDLRTEEETAEDPDQLPDGMPYLHLPAQSDDNRLLQLTRMMLSQDYFATLLPDLYTRVMIDGNPQVFAEIFRRAADADQLPLVIHCAAGKDRTGIAVALILRVLGVPEDVVIADYTLSNHYNAYFRSMSERAMGQLNVLGISEGQFAPLLLADGAVMQATLDHIRGRYGSISNYLKAAAGLDAATLDKVRENLLI